MTEQFSLQVESLAKSFNYRSVFFDITFALHSREGLGIVGRNGSGKSTLAKIVAGVLSPTGGTVRYSVGNEPVAAVCLHDYIGFVAPYLQLYDEFSAWENLDLCRRIRGTEVPDERLKDLLQRVGLIQRKDHLVRTYSSGMKQRLKYACALLHQPPLLILDEPSSNLDAEGVGIVRQLMKEQIGEGILVVATNEADDLQYCSRTIDLNVFDNNRRAKNE